MSFHSFRGQPSTRATRRSNGFTQASTRHSVHSFDQHGRQWSWEGDNHSGMPTSILSPLFSAPFMPDNQYILVNPDNTSECYIDYVSMYRSRAEALASYHRQAVRYAVKHKLPAPAMGDYSDEIEEANGIPPESLELVAAAAQENPWVLGFSDVPDPRLERFLKQTSNTITEIMDTFDFAPASYAEATAAVLGHAAPGRKEKPRRFTSFASLAELQDAAGVDASGVPVDGGDSAEGLDEELDASFEAIDAVVPTAAESVEVEASAEANEGKVDDADEALFDIEDDTDAEALGGRTVDPKKSAIAERQAPRRSSQTAIPRKRGRAQSAAGAPPKGVSPTNKMNRTPAKAFDHAARPSMADGAVPYVPPLDE